MPAELQHDESPDRTQRDEALGDQLDRHLEGLRTTGAAPAASTQPDDELHELLPVVNQLQGLSEFLAKASGRGSTFDPAAAETGDYASASTGDVVPVHGTPSGPVGPLEMGARIGKYEVRRALGHGGQASAYLAFDPDLQRHVVIKLYHAARSSAWRDMLISEGRALARVRSPFVAQCYGVEQHEDSPYLVMEYISGKSLAEMLSAGSPDRTSALSLLRRVAEGLTAIHACGLLHRDIKPANIIVADDGLPRLVDFGLAAHLASEALRSVSGTLAYMAPEQARGEIERIDPRTDLFGLGAVLYEMLTGRPPYRAKSHAELLEAAQRGDVVPPRQRKPEIPSALDTLCMRCLAKDPTQRFSSAAELIREIDAVTRGKSRLLAGLDARFGRPAVRTALVAAALLLCVLPVVLWCAFFRSPEGSGGGGTPTGGNIVGTGANPGDRPLRRDFAVKVKLLDHPEDPSGRWKLVEGEHISFSVDVARDAYVGVWYVDHEGKVVQLFPNDYDTDHLIRAGQPRVIPGMKKYGIVVTPLAGPEHVRVLATTRHWRPVAGERAGPEGIYAVFRSPEQIKEWQDGVRGLALTPDPQLRDLDSAVSELIIPLEVKPK